jgi:hypothetical protein
MVKDLFKGWPISSDTVISAENMIIEEADKLRIYEFDVSFK